MSIGRWVTVGLAAIAAVGGYFTVPLMKLESVTAEVVAALALLAALLAPYMLMLATSLQRDGMSSTELKQVAEVFKQLLNSSMSLLVIYLTTLTIFVMLKAITTTTINNISNVFGQSVAALLCGLVVLSLVRTFRLAVALKYLQDKRHDLLIKAQQTSEAERAKIFATNINVAPAPINSPAYGRVKPLTKLDSN